MKTFHVIARKTMQNNLISKDSPSMVTSEGATPFKCPNNNLFLKRSPIEEKAGSDI